MIGAYTITTYGPAEYLCRVGLIPGTLKFIDGRKKRLLIAEIQQATADRFRIRESEMHSARRSRDVARPRQVAMYLSKHLTLKSIPEIGRRFGGRDHTTVIHACRQIEKLRQLDPALDADIIALTKGLGG